MMVVSVEQHRDCRSSLPYMLSFLEGIINQQLLVFGHWDSPPGLPAVVLSRVATMYRERGWRVTWKNASKRIRIWCTCEKKGGVCITRAKP